MKNTNPELIYQTINEETEKALTDIGKTESDNDDVQTVKDKALNLLAKHKKIVDDEIES